MKIAEKAQKHIPATGSVTATVTRSGSPPEDFNASCFDVYTLNGELHIWAQQGSPECFDAIALRIPFDTPDGDHALVPGGSGVRGIRAAFFKKSAGAGDYAEEGKLIGFEWGSNKESVKFQFEFSVGYGPREYRVNVGALQLACGEGSGLKNLRAAGTVQAIVYPPLVPDERLFQSSDVSFVPESSGRYHRMLAWQPNECPEAGQDGILLRVGNADPKQSFGIFYRAGEIVYVNNINMKWVDWNKEKRTFKAEFEFLIFDDLPVGPVIKDGKVDLSY